MLRTLIIAFGLVIAGNVFVGMLAVPVPGAALGMVLLTLGFALNGGPDKDSEQLFDAMSPHIPLFFIPAAVGVVANADVLAQSWIHIAIAVAVGTAATIAATAALTQVLLDHIGKARIA